jgi:hypothetical protein
MESVHSMSAVVLAGLHDDTKCGLCDEPGVEWFLLPGGSVHACIHHANEVREAERNHQRHCKTCQTRLLTEPA